MTDRDAVRSRLIAVVGGGSPYRHLSTPVIEGIATALTSSGYRAELVDAEAGDFVPRVQRFDVAFIAHFGLRGDSGTLQGLFATLHIPYTGSGLTATAVAQDKVLSKRLFRAHGLRTPDFAEFDLTSDLRSQARTAGDRLGLPLVVKPVLTGGSHGLHLACSLDDVVAAVLDARRYGPVFAERLVRGQTVTSGVLGCGDWLTVLPPLEVVFADGRPFVDSKLLWQPGAVTTVHPPRVGPDVAREVAELAHRAHLALGAHGLSRTDFVVDADGRAQILELNTLPGMGPTSDLTIAAGHLGLSFADLVERILLTAAERPPHER